MFWLKEKYMAGDGACISLKRYPGEMMKTPWGLIECDMYKRFVKNNGNSIQ